MTKPMKEGRHYSIIHSLRRPGRWNQYLCLNCGRKVPYEYDARQRMRGRVCGTRQLMRIYAWNNFNRHLLACWTKPPGKAEEDAL